MTRVNKGNTATATLRCHNCKDVVKLDTRVIAMVALDAKKNGGAAIVCPYCEGNAIDFFRNET